MVKFIIILLVFFLLPRKASADIGSLFGGSDAPEYRQISPESTMTESQKAMQQYLTALGKMGYEQGMKAFDPERAKRSNAFYNATLSAIQGGGMGMNPKDINAAVAQTMANQPVVSDASTTTPANANSFVPDEKMDFYVQLYDKNTASLGDRWKKLNPNQTLNGIPIAAIEEYKRRKEQARGADALSKYQGVK